MRSKAFLFILFLVSSFGMSAQDRITIRIIGLENGVPVENAHIALYNSDSLNIQSVATSDNEGNAVVTVLTYPTRLEIVVMGYDPQRLIITDKSESLINVKLIKRSSSLDEVVITGVTKPTKPADALSVYKIISAASMKSMGAVSLDQALANQLNIDTRNDGVLGPQFRMQGLKGDKVKILVDGMPMNGREAGNVNLSQINLNNAERVEVVQGPMSIMYGTDALGGVINLISKDNRKPWEVSAGAFYESIGTYNINASATKSWKRHAITLGGGRNYSNGWLFLDTASPHRNKLFDPKEQYLASVNYSYRAASGFKLRLASDFIKEKITNRGEAFISPYEAYAFDDYYRTTRSLNRLLLDGKVGKQGHWQMMNGFSYYQHIKNSYRKDLVTLSEDLLSAVSQDTSTFNDVSSRSTYGTKKNQFDLSIGYDVNYQTGNSGKIPGGTRNMGNYAFFGTVALPIIKDQLTVQVGGRVEYNTSYKSPVTPAVNLLYKPKKNIQIRTSYAKGFRTPTLKELYLTFIDQNHHVMGNPDLKAEVSDHLQLSFSSQVFERQANYAQILIVGYYNDVKDGIVLSPDHPDDPASLDHTYRNVSRLRNAIGSIEIEGQQQSFHYKLGYSYTYTFADNGNYSAFDANELIVNIQYYWKWSRLNFSLFNKFTGTQPMLVGNMDGSASYSGRQPEYDMMDFSLERKFFKNKVQIVAGVKNILNVQRLAASGVAVGAHSGNGSVNFLPRRVFSSLNISLQ